MNRCIIFTISVLVLFGLFALWGCGNNRENYLIQQGNEFVKKIEQYKEVNNRLPASLSDVGIVVKDEANPPIYYERRDSIHYTVWFGTTLGESKIYYSDSRKWENFYREMK